MSEAPLRQGSVRGGQKELRDDEVGVARMAKGELTFDKSPCKAGFGAGIAPGG